MSASNVVENTEFETTEQPLSKEAATDLYHESATEAALEARKPSNVVKAGARFGRATTVKVFRARFKGLTPSEILDALASS